MLEQSKKGGASMPEIILSLIALGEAFFKVLFAVPVLGIMVLLATFGPMTIKAVKHR